MKKFLILLIFLLNPGYLYALDFNEALSKLTSPGTSDSKNSGSNIMDKLGCNIKEVALQQITDLKQQILGEVDPIKLSVEEVRQKAGASLDEINNAVAKLDKYDALVEKYLFYMKMAMYAMFGLIILSILMLVLLYMKVANFQKKIVSSVVSKAVG